MTHVSLSDQQMIKELKQGREQLLSGTSSRTLLHALRRRLQSITRDIYILSCIPEQSEDLYDVLVDGVIVVHVEIPRGRQSAEEAFQIWPVEEYVRKKLERPKRRMLELALRLSVAERAKN